MNLIEVVISYFQNDFFRKKSNVVNIVKIKVNMQLIVIQFIAKVINMVANKNKTKTMTKHIPCDSKCKFHSKSYNSNQEWNNETSI